MKKKKKKKQKKKKSNYFYSYIGCMVRNDECIYVNPLLPSFPSRSVAVPRLKSSVCPTIHSKLNEEKKWIKDFPNGISEKLNANNFVQNLNSARRNHLPKTITTIPRAFIPAGCSMAVIHSEKKEQKASSRQCAAFSKAKFWKLIIIMLLS